MDDKASAIDLVRNAVNNTIGKFTKIDIMELVLYAAKNLLGMRRKEDMIAYAQIQNVKRNILK